mmetsp:Transcript_6448/g.7209  ORF Transcript_6448/g.7209 Transcript_6448/m.7209 type:complete len:227 (+) Transcript_6448:23-703(+)|eukprot:CAMPEP_0205823452 /NCGR_PEP_ID=MMETSP0206-20130828/16586_1 /ASSEMBLY_ACC=CAM_ASM_000279 /TAXON_ID=36767 /ORGANISM="Euplotes focardii, Strain TN1" /LENGTH=226 /DNA_ID=CAMNT_0053120627 /DNA_START=21 /DNA_END=701 /DNA_ORIENTATION=+
MADEELKSQGYIRIGDVSPDFTSDSTNGELNWHKYIDGKWGILFSHPADFTPVCTSEIGTVAKLKAEWAKRDTVVAVVSVDDVASHHKWIKEINDITGSDVDFPIFGDETKKIAMAYGMLDATHLNAAGLPLTVRSVFIVDPDKKIKLIITYPASTGRNFDEIIRVLDSLQATRNKKLATPANWNVGDDYYILPSVSEADATANFPDFKVASAGCKIRTTSGKGPQ